MAYTDSLSCCGVVELANIMGQKPETILSSGCQDYFEETPRAFIIFTVIGKSKSGQNLVDYIKKNTLGKVKKIGKKLNQNTGNKVTMWTWAINNPGLKSLALKKGWYKKPEW